MHVLLFRGKSSSNKHAAFRECFIKLGELRSLVPTTFVVLTATATEETKQEIFEVLLMADPYVITESPNKLNITYYVSYINKYDKLNELFKWLTDELLERGVDCTRTIIYCQTITLYAVLRESLGERNVLDQNNKCMVLIEMLHSCTPEANKREILSSFQKVDGSIRVLVATISFGMGVDSKGVTNVVHFGPSKNVESYIQETGRAGRGGTHGNAFLLYSSLLLRHVDKDMKSYVKTECCRREFLLSFFEPARSVVKPSPDHLCCDSCALKCKCGLTNCGVQSCYPVTSSMPNPLVIRDVSLAEREQLKNKLFSYYKGIVQSLKKSTTQEGKAKVLFAPKFLLGFSEHHILQTVEHCHEIFSYSDIYTHVEIWDEKHAVQIYKILNDVFGDLEEYTFALEENIDDEAFQQWNEIANDEELLGLVLDCSQLTLDDTFTDNSHSSVDLSGDVHTYMYDSLLPDMVFE
jgi:ATP-dependent DNA helicase RecQ